LYCQTTANYHNSITLMLVKCSFSSSWKLYHHCIL